MVTYTLIWTWNQAETVLGHVSGYKMQRWKSYCSWHVVPCRHTLLPLQWFNGGHGPGCRKHFTVHLQWNLLCCMLSVLSLPLPLLFTKGELNSKRPCSSGHHYAPRSPSASQPPPQSPPSSPTHTAVSQSLGSLAAAVKLRVSVLKN